MTLRKYIQFSRPDNGFITACVVLDDSNPPIHEDQIEVDPDTNTNGMIVDLETLALIPSPPEPDSPPDEG